MNNIRFVMNTVAELHRLGYGKLKLYAYLSSLGAWRHVIFASDSLPNSIDDIPEPKLVNSYPWHSEPTVIGQSIQAAARHFIKAHPELVASARGKDDAYLAWYKWALLLSEDNDALVMQSPDRAAVGSQCYSRYQANDTTTISAWPERSYALLVSLWFFSKHLMEICCYANTTGMPVIVEGSGAIGKFALVTPNNLALLSKLNINDIKFSYPEEI